MVFPLSAAAQAALRGSHTVAYRATAYTSAGVVALPIAGGSVTADAKSQVRRTAQLRISDVTLWDALAPFGTEVFIEYGIVTQAGVEWVPMIWGPAMKSADTRPRDTANGFTVDVSDRSVLIAQNAYETPTQTGPAGTYVSEITRLITGTLPTVTVTDTTGNTTLLPQLTIDKDPWVDGIEKIADSIGAECFADRVGNFVLRPVPDDTYPEVWVVDEGATGVLVQANRQLTRELVYNAVIVTGQRTDGTPPVLARIYDTDPDSQTYYGGPFGKKPRFFTSAAITSTAQATIAGNALLARARGTQATLSFTTITHPGLDPGDVILSRVDGVTLRHVIDQVTTPLDPTSPQTLSTRSKNLPQES